MIVLENVRKKFNTKLAIENISFHVEQGEKLVLLGISGCGKTTTLRMINRLLDPDRGTIKVNGKDVKDQSREKLRRGIGYVLQNNALFPHFTVAENIAVVPNLLKWDKAKTRERASQLIAKLHLDSEHLSAYPHELSGGQQQRIGLARALMTDPPILLMDEALGALDPITRVSIRKEFKNLDELKRKTVVMVTHDVSEAFELGDRICLMDQGKVVQIGTASELLNNPSNNFVKAFLEEQRLQLQLRAVHIEQLWEYIPVRDLNQNDRTLSSKSTLWELASYLDGGTKIITIRNELTGQLKSVGFNDLMKLFSTYKNSR